MKKKQISELLAMRENFQALAKKAKTSPANLLQIAYGHGKAGAAMAIRIEKASGGVVTRAALRPDLFG